MHSFLLKVLLFGQFPTSSIDSTLAFQDNWTDWIESDQDDIDLETVDFRANKSQIFDRWHRCVTENLLGFQDALEFWKNFVKLSARCDSEAKVEQMGIVSLRNSDEKKHILFPKINSGSHNLYTIGVGRDIRAEKQYRRKMRKLGHRVDFFGADPIPYINSDLYSQIGMFFPFAVGGKSGITKARVMEKYGYVETNMVHIDISYFFRDILNVTKIDNLWFDAEGAEYGGIFEAFYRNGTFDRNGIDLCQINIEIHVSSDVERKKEYFMEFIRRLIDEKRYGFFFGDEFIHMRMYLFNFRNPYCLGKF